MTAVLAVLATATAVVTLATVIVSLFVALRGRRRVEQIHVLVNARLDETLERVEQLSNTLRGAGIDVPPSQSDEQR